MGQLVALIGLIVSGFVAGGIAIFVTQGGRELGRVAVELASLLSVVVLICLTLLFATGAIPY
jgi:hypothetical protein